MQLDVRRWKMRLGMAALASMALLSRVCAPGFAADISPVERALQSAVRIEVSLCWPGHEVDFSGSGWTRRCTPHDSSFTLVIATAAHVIDVDDLIKDAHPRSGGRPQVKVVVIYRDGRQYTAGRQDALRVDRAHDYGEVVVEASEAHSTLPTGLAAEVAEGTALFTIASPGRLRFGTYRGNLVCRHNELIPNVPSDSWLASIPVAPGASGAPVLTEQGLVVATVVGYIDWPWGGWNSIVIPLAPSLFALSQDQYREEMKAVDFVEQVIPMLKAGAIVALAMTLSHIALSILSRNPKLSQELAFEVTTICESVVRAVEQAHGDLAAVDKKQLAVEIVTQIVGEMGISVPASLIDAGIEAAVLTLDHLTGTRRSGA